MLSRGNIDCSETIAIAMTAGASNLLTVFPPSVALTVTVLLLSAGRLSKRKIRKDRLPGNPANGLVQKTIFSFTIRGELPTVPGNLPLEKGIGA